MEISNLKEHQGCPCYGMGENLLVELLELSRGSKFETSIPHNSIVFMLKGKIRYALNGYPPLDISRGSFVFMPSNRQLHYTARQNSLMLIVKLTESLRLCSSFGIEQLYNKMKSKEAPRAILPLAINARLRHFANGLRDTYRDGIMCRYLFEAKIKELLILLWGYYSDEQLYGFFLPVLSPDTEFSEFVRKNHLIYKTVNDMAAAMNFSTAQFTRKFNSIFLQNPGEWMQLEKAKAIHDDICNLNKTLKEIARDHGFAAPTHLNRFCKRTFNMTPGEIRKKGGK